MLNNGVKRIIEQVVNPKIMQAIKPKVDEVVCEHFNISLKERQEKAKQKQLEQQQKQQQQQENVLNSPQSGGIVNLMSITFSSPPPGITEILPVKSPTVMTLRFRTYRSWQTVQTQIRLLLEEQSDQGLHCLLFHLHLFDEIPKCLASFLEF